MERRGRPRRPQRSCRRTPAQAPRPLSSYISSRRKVKMRNSERGMEKEKWQMTNAGWQMTDAGWRMGDDKCRDERGHPKERWSASCCALNKRDGLSFTIARMGVFGRLRLRTKDCEITPPSKP